MGPIPADCRAVAIVAILWLGFALLDRRWRIEPRLRQPDDVSTSERVVVVVPARNEAQQLPRTLPSLLAQDHPHLSIVVVDDHSDDGTGAVARRIANEAGAADRVTVITPPPLPAGWTGKVWAQHHGVERALAERPDWIWLTDADVRREPDGLRRLLATARAEGRDLVSVMARLHCETLWERLLIPAFTYFFAALYPFPSVGRDGSRVAGAAGGCMLVRREVIQRIGGMGAIREAVIDDVSFGRACKAAGARLWLGYRPLALIGCVLALVFLFFVPVFAVLFGSSAARLLGAVALAAMVRTYAPMVRHLRAGFVWALTLPAAVALYVGMTISSAWRHHSGAGATWKGRAYHAGG